MIMDTYKVHLYYDGPLFHDDATVRVSAENEADAVREAIVYAGLPKVGEVTVDR
jgi:hypothetical protein